MDELDADECGKIDEAEARASDVARRAMLAFQLCYWSSRAEELRSDQRSEARKHKTATSHARKR